MERKKDHKTIIKTFDTESDICYTRDKRHLAFIFETSEDMHMQYRELGKTGLPISALSLGGLFLSSRGASFEAAKEATLTAIDKGVNFVDTAPTYRDSEVVLGGILNGRKDVVISTKLGGYPHPFDARSRKCLMESFEHSLEVLGRDHIDILMIHEPDRAQQYNWFDVVNGKLDGPVIDFLAELKEKGLIKHTGLGGTSAYELARVMEYGDFDVVLTAFQYSLLWREAEHSILPTAAKKNMGVVIGSPLQHGALATRYDDEVNHGAPWMSLPRRKQFKRLYELLDRIDIPVAELSIRFLLSNPLVSTVLVGARNRTEVDLNCAAEQKGPLPQDLIDEINDIAAMVPFRPFEEPYSMPFGREYNGLGALR